MIVRSLRRLVVCAVDLEADGIVWPESGALDAAPHCVEAGEVGRGVGELDHAAVVAGEVGEVFVRELEDSGVFFYDLIMGVVDVSIGLGGVLGKGLVWRLSMYEWGRVGVKGQGIYNGDTGHGHVRMLW